MWENRRECGDASAQRSDKDKSASVHETGFSWQFQDCGVSMYWRRGFENELVVLGKAGVRIGRIGYVGQVTLIGLVE